MSYEFKNFSCFNLLDKQEFIDYINADNLRKTSIVELYNEWKNPGIIWTSIESIIDQFLLWNFKDIIFSLIIYNNCIVGIANSINYQYSSPINPLNFKNTNLICNVRISIDQQGKKLCEKIISSLINYLLFNNHTYPVILEVLINNISAIKCYCKNNFNDFPLRHHQDIISKKILNWMILDKDLYIKNLIKELAEVSYNINNQILLNLKKYKYLNTIIYNYLLNYLHHNAIKID